MLTYSPCYQLHSGPQQNIMYSYTTHLLPTEAVRRLAEHGALVEIGRRVGGDAWVTVASEMDVLRVWEASEAKGRVKYKYSA
jgi:hypothetical protein